MCVCHVYVGAWVRACVYFSVWLGAIPRALRTTCTHNADGKGLQDRIFQNIYGEHDTSITGAMRRGDWYQTDKIVQKVGRKLHAPWVAGVMREVERNGHCCVHWDTAHEAARSMW